MLPFSKLNCSQSSSSVILFANMADYSPFPCHPVHLLAHSQSYSYHASLIFLSCFLLLVLTFSWFTPTSTLSSLICLLFSSYHHFNHHSAIFLERCATLFVPRMWSSRIIYLRFPPHIHCSVFILFTSNYTFIYTIICLKSVGVRKLQVAILALSPREMSLSDRILPKYILSRVRVSVRPSIFFLYAKKPQTRVARMLFISMVQLCGQIYN